MRSYLRKLPLAVTAGISATVLMSCFATAVYADGSKVLVNNSDQTIIVKSGVNKYAPATTLKPGAHLVIPASEVANWGDNKNHYFQMTTTSGKAVCTHLKWGRLPAHENHQITAKLNCAVYNGAAPEDSPAVDEPSENTLPTDDNPDQQSTHDNNDTAANPSAPSGNYEPASPVVYKLRPKGNGTWLYDAQFSDGPTGAAYTKAGLWAKHINDYNKGARAGSKIDQLFTYGGNLEMYCLGSGESSPGTACNSKNLLVLYYPPAFYNANLDIAKLGESGFHSTQEYKRLTALLKQETHTDVQIIPIIDGRVDNPSSNDYLNAFNHMDKKTAQTFADNVARVYCADNDVAGIQFDIEPFRMDNNHMGQVYFYERMADVLAGKHPSLDLRCKNAHHPDGRSFSVFTFPQHITARVAEVLDKNKNGYAVYSLYDLEQPGKAKQTIGGQVLQINTPQEYYGLVMHELRKAMHKATEYAPNYVYFQVAIPAAASVHEFESVNGDSTGYTQLDYIKSAMRAINDSGVRQNPYFLGIAIWGWSVYMTYPPHSANVFQPSWPQQDVLQYLQQNL